ncbi:nucleotidyltransferase domain-containing protein [Halorubrum sp. Atlit-26R]|uniref:nucleotidyltransferase domain-containing protein n=1 Tax=Halorubrum sp. Atlit-26R TaxID=2282128 RepID=UPI000EF26118|nr:nucleotidyltransferase domain-containing protein [Halorubrum sp. Atlit-26R]RLM68349.1 nucleotidyltransferase domain-containing protein [Halorubrum sp. Atlit-26R]
MTIKFDLDSDYRQALPPNGAAFLQEVAALLDDESVVSVLLFGSVVTGEATAISDIDLLVVLGDGVSETDREAVRSEIVRLAEKHLDIEQERGNQVEHVVDRATGMFRSGFVVTESDIECGRFHDIFNTSRLAYALAPWRTVLRAVFTQTEAIYGPRVAPDWSGVTPPEARRGRELARSAGMSTLLAAAQLVYAFVSPRAVRYAMEAHKWTLYNCAFHLTGSRAPTLAAASDTVPGIARLDKWLLDLRETPRVDRLYLLFVAPYVALVHVRTLLAVGDPNDDARDHD